MTWEYSEDMIEQNTKLREARDILLPKLMNGQIEVKIMAKKTNIQSDGFNEILLYTTPNGKVKVEMYLQNETIWLTHQKIADLFGVDRTVVTKHIGNIFKSGELQEQLVCANFAHTTQHGAIKGKTQETTTKFYNLDAIISVAQNKLIESDFDKALKIKR